MCKKLIYLASLVLVLGLALSSVVEAGDPDLAGWWRLNDGSGTVAVDSSGNDRDGTLVGGPQWVAGKLRGALQFDGIDDYVNIDGYKGINAIGGIQQPFSIANWFRITAASGDHEMVTWGTSAGQQRLTWRVHEGRLRTEHASGNLRGNTYVNDGEWHHGALVVTEGANLRVPATRLYVDGVEDTTFSGSDTAYNLTAGVDVRIGMGGPTGGRFFPGSIDDVYIFSRALTADEIKQVMEGLSLGSASKPIPDDEAINVPREVDLGWKPGEFANTHNVYLGTAFDDVNDAVLADAVSAGQTAATYDPPVRLDLNQTYYWRIDEVNAPPDSTVFKGDVWSFTTELFAYPVENITATASSSSPNQGPENTVNGSGLADDLHSAEFTDVWITALGDAGPAWIQYEFDKALKLDEMLVWNYNDLMESILGLGCKEVTIEYSVNGTDFTALGTTHEFARAPGAAGYAANTTVDFGGAAAKYVKLTANSNWGSILTQYGLSEVRFLSVPVQAREPDPASGATDVGVEATLSWRAGREADKHDVYLSTDEQAVIDGTAPVETVTDASYSASLDVDSTYYWRVDEVNDAETTATWQGDIWNLSTPEFLVVDDFELYNDIAAGEEGSNLVYETWIDGYANPSVNGSTMGYTVAFQPSLETSIVYDGGQSAPLFYDNTTAGYSEVTANVADLQVVRDWTRHGIKVLALWFKGDLRHAAADQLYVKINGTKVVYGGDLTSPLWQPFSVDLASLGINLSNITTLSIGVDGSSSGMLLVDGIALYQTAPLVAGPPPGGDPSLVGHWKLDETSGLTAADSSGYGNHGTLRNNDGTLMTMDGTEWTAGIKDGALFLENGQYVDFGNDKSLQLSRDGTISAWVKMDPANEDVYMGIGGKLTANPYEGFELVRHSTNVFRLWVRNIEGTDLTGISSDVTYNDTDWHHVVGVVDNDTGYLYVDGVKQAEEGAVTFLDTGSFAYIGKHYSNETARYWIGTIDDFRIYYRALSAAEILGL